MNNIKKTYITPELNIISINQEDLIRTSESFELPKVPLSMFLDS